jgi:hypothetical protein
MASAEPPVSRLPRVVFACALLVSLLFAGVVYHKAIRLGQGDQDVFFRAGWAIRQGGTELYHIMDHHGWHFHYPPLYAIFMVPLADPPPWISADQAGMVLPRTVRVLLLYAFNVACLFAAVFLLAGCMDNPRRRLHLLVWPVVFCIPAIGLTLMRGQVDTLLLLLLAGFSAGLVHGRRATAGVCLALAICIKIIPAFLVLVPLWRRDRRCLLGCAAGLFAGLWLVPALFLGPDRTLELYHVQRQVFLEPALGMSKDRSRAGELLDAGANHSQSFQKVIHQTMYHGQEQVPARPAGWVRGLHWLLVAGLTALVLWRQRRAVDDARNLVGFVALMTVLMVLASPISHLHYFTLALPLALFVGERVLDGKAGRLAVLALLLLPLGHGAVMLPPLRPLRDLGLPMYVTLGLWTAGLVALRPGGAAVPAARSRAA